MEEAARANNIAIIDEGRIAAYDSPFKLKETYASDRIRVFSDSYDKVIEIANKYKMTYKEKSNHITITIPDTRSAIPILDELSPHINSFEVVQGTMDDAF